jgi:hypothetical protein
LQRDSGDGRRELQRVLELLSTFSEDFVCLGEDPGIGNPPDVALEYVVQLVINA